MTISEVTSVVTQDRKQSRMRKVTFTHETAGGAGTETATTTFTLCGRLVRVAFTAGEAGGWNFSLSDGVATIWTGEMYANAAKSLPLYMDTTDRAGHLTTYVKGIPICGPLTCTTTSVATVAPAITIYWEEDK